MDDFAVQQIPNSPRIFLSIQIGLSEMDLLFMLEINVRLGWAISHNQWSNSVRQDLVHSM